jgi:hypothetical protein
MNKKILREYLDVDGYWIELKPGWRMPGDAHGIVENTKREAKARLKDVVKCDCQDCRRT